MIGIGIPLYFWFRTGSRFGERRHELERLLRRRSRAADGGAFLASWFVEKSRKSAVARRFIDQAGRLVPSCGRHEIVPLALRVCPRFRVVRSCGLSAESSRPASGRESTGRERVDARGAAVGCAGEDRTFARGRGARHVLRG